MLNYSHTKIIATVGPACNTKVKLLELAVAGVNVFRLNFSHGNHAQKLKVIKIIKELNEETDLNLAILQDLQGPKIRVGEIEGGSMLLEDGSDLVIGIDDRIGEDNYITTTYKSIVKDVKKGDKVLMDDGNISVEVSSIDKDKEQITTKVIHGGLLKSNKGINLPNTAISMPALTSKDEKDLKFGLKHGVHWVAISFVRQASEILRLKTIIKNYPSEARVIAKIERPEAITNIDYITDITDAIMVARGDLGVELDFERLPVLQKEIIEKARQKAKPVIVATQMMESMIENPRPTRAEAVDVANAITDGADAVMLSAETATGNHPIKVIKCVKRIIKHVELRGDIYNRYYELDKINENNYRSSTVLEVAVKLSQQTRTRLIACISQSGFSARRLASFRPKPNVIVYVPNAFLKHCSALFWGVRAFICPPFQNTDEAYTHIEDHLKQNGLIQSEDVYINTSSMPLQKNDTNTIRIIKAD